MNGKKARHLRKAVALITSKQQLLPYQRKQFYRHSKDAYV